MHVMSFALTLALLSALSLAILVPVALLPSAAVLVLMLLVMVYRPASTVLSSCLAQQLCNYSLASLVVFAVSQFYSHNALPQPPHSEGHP